MKRPNFLIFMTDQQNGLTQPPDTRAFMPNLQRLASQGVTFTQAYCPAPHCCPSRASFFSGLYPSEHGVWNNVDVPNTLSRGLFSDVRLFSEDLRDAGYDLFFSGKWHVSAEEGPDRRGFELIHHTSHQQDRYQPRENRPDIREWRLYSQDRQMRPLDKPRQAGEIIRPCYPEYLQYGEKENPFSDQDVVSLAVAKIQQISPDKPFMIYVGTLGPHDPYFLPQRFLDLYDPNQIQLPESFSDDLQDKPHLYQRTRDRFAQLTPEEHKESIRHYLAFCSYEDYLFGQLLDGLSERSLLEDTVVIYVSDHGDYMGAHRLWTKGLPCFKEAYHICSTIGYGTVRNRNRLVDDFVSLVDYAPTILEMAGITTESHFAGQSMLDFLQHDRPDHWRNELYTQSNGNELYGIQRAVFDRKYKLVYNGFDYDELYNLEKDPNEMVNIINDPDYKSVVRRLYQKLWQFAYANQDNITNDYIMTALAQYGPGIIYEDKLKAY